MTRDRAVTLPTEHSHWELPPSPTRQMQEGFSEIAGTGYIPGGAQDIRLFQDKPVHPASCTLESSPSRAQAALRLGTAAENRALSKSSSFQTSVIFSQNPFDPLIKAKWDMAENEQQPEKPQC